MATDIEQIVQTAKLNASFTASRALLKTKFQQACIVAHNGGLFELNPALLQMMQWYNSVHGGNAFVVLDKQEMPIRVENPKALLQEWSELYQTLVNEYHLDIQNLRQIRNTTQLAA